MLHKSVMQPASVLTGSYKMHRTVNNTEAPTLDPPFHDSAQSIGKDVSPLENGRAWYETDPDGRSVDDDDECYDEEEDDEDDSECDASGDDYLGTGTLVSASRVRG